MLSVVMLIVVILNVVVPHIHTHTHTHIDVALRQARKWPNISNKSRKSKHRDHSTTGVTTISMVVSFREFEHGHLWEVWIPMEVNRRIPIV